MSIMNEYIQKKFTVAQYEEELLSLISKYNQLKNTFLLIFFTFTEKPLPIKLLMLSQDDYYTINDLICKKNHLNSIDIYLESPGGRGDTAKELADLFHSCTEEVNFVICGEAKSAATILTLSGNNILMTRTGSLGPIDAQVTIGNRTVSSFDYIQWIEDKREEAKKIGKLNPVDATIIAQIIPGEALYVMNALEFAKDLVKEWLPKYKFKNWFKTETHKNEVTEEYRKKRAYEVAEALVNREKWKLHQMSIKASDLKEVLKIEDIDQNLDLKDTVYKIHIVCRILCSLTNTYKIFATSEYKIFKQAGQQQPSKILTPKGEPNVVEIDISCPKCSKKYNLYGKFIDDPEIDKEMKKKGSVQFPESNKLNCSCGFEFNLLPYKSDIERNIGKRII